MISEFSLPAEPTPQQAALEETILGWIVRLLPWAIIGGILALLAGAAVLIALNFNILSWIE